MYYKGFRLEILLTLTGYATEKLPQSYEYKHQPVTTNITLIAQE